MASKMLRFVRACLVDYLSDGPLIQPPLPLPSQEAFWLALNEQLLKVDRCLPATQQLLSPPKPCASPWPDRAGRSHGVSFGGNPFRARPCNGRATGRSRARVCQMRWRGRAETALPARRGRGPLRARGAPQARCRAMPRNAPPICLSVAMPVCLSRGRPAAGSSAAGRGRTGGAN